VTLRICVSILPKNNREALKLIKKSEKATADFIEVRLDYLQTKNLQKLAESTKIPLIATNKLVSEKGFFVGTETERQQTLLNAAKSGFEYVDVDLSSPMHIEIIGKLKQVGAKPIVSYHKYDGTLSSSEMEKVLEQEIASGANVCKIVTTATKVEDNLGVLSFVSARKSRTKLVCFCMGKQGTFSRFFSLMCGAFFTFASLEQGSETAIGQMSIQSMRTLYDIFGE